MAAYSTIMIYLAADIVVDASGQKIYRV